MHYEFNISLNGSHLFATHERSVTDSDKATKVRDILTEKFPESEGYKVSLHINPGVNFGVLIDADIKQATNNIYGLMSGNRS